MPIRKYSSRSQQTTLGAAITSTAATMTVVNAAAVMGGKTVTGTQTYTVVIDPDTALEEIVDVTVYSSGNTLNITRGVDGPTPGTGVAHSAGAVVRHMAIGRDYQDANDHIEATTGTIHGLVVADIVKVTDTGTVVTAMIAANAVTTSKIIDGTVTSAKIVDGTIVAGDIADGAITSAKILNDTIVNADINSAAAIAYSKLNLAGSITSSDITDGTIVNADVNTSAQIAYGKLNLTNAIVNGDINASAAIALSKLATDPLARANHTGTQLAATVSDFDTQVRTSRLDQMTAPTGSVSLNSQKITNLATPTSNTDAATKAYADLMIPLTQKGAANGVAELDADGLLPANRLPSLSITTTQVVATQAAMLALTAQTGDVAVRTDLNKTFILTASPATTLGNWQELLTPTDAVLSVDGQTGTVSLSSTYATITQDAAKLPLAGGTMSGAIAMGTNKITGLGTPTAGTDATTKTYVDGVLVAPSNLTGPITSVGSATSIASQTGTGTKFVVDTSPTLVTPELGVATATSINGTTIPASKTLVATDSTVYVVPSQGGNSGKALTTDGTTSSWSTTINGTAIPATKTLVTTDTTAYVSTAGGSTVTASGIGVIPLVLKGASGQTADLLQIQNNAGTSLVEVDSAGRLLINLATTNGPDIEVVNRNGGNGTIVARGSSATDVVVIQAQSSDFYSTPSYRMTGIGQHGASSTGTTAGLSNAGLGMLIFQNASASLIGSNNSIPIVFAPGYVERMRIDSSGNVGIGTTSPTASTRLTLSDTNSTKLLLTGGSTQNGIFLNTVGTAKKYYIGAGNNLLNIGDKGFVILDVDTLTGKFFVADDTGETRTAATTYLTNYTNGAERMRINSSGDVGIGTTSPSSKLTVGGNPPAAGALAAVGSTGGISLALSDNLNNSLYVRHTGSTGGAIIGTDATNGLRFATNGNTGSEIKVLIDTVGKVVLYPTVSLSGTNAQFLIYPPSTGQGITSGVTLYSTFTGTSDNGPRRTADIVGGYSGGSWGNEYLSFNVGVGGGNDAGNITTERMRVNGAGNVGIGTASPTAKLDVNGSIQSNNLSSVNALLNSSFNVWQRGTAVVQTTNGYSYTADRWSVISAGLSGPVTTVSRQATSDTTNLPNIQYCARVQRNAGQTGTGGIYFAQFMETVNSIPYAGKTATLSFYARKGANYSQTSSLLEVYLIGGTGTDQNQFAGYTSQTLPVNTIATLTTTWQRFTFTGSVGATVTELTAEFGFSASGTAGASDYFEITGVQIELGSVATPYRSNQPTYQAELAACQRYYYTLFDNTSTDAQFGPVSRADSTYCSMTFFLPVPMRIKPTIDARATAFGNFMRAVAYDTSFNIVTNDITGVAVNASSFNSQAIDVSFTLRSAISGSYVYITLDSFAHGTSKVAFSAEI